MIFSFHFDHGDTAMTALIDNEVIAATASTFTIEQRQQAVANLRKLADNRQDMRLQTLADAFELSQNGNIAQAVALFKTLYDSAETLGDCIHLGTKLVCANVSALAEQNNFSTLVQLNKVLEQSCTSTIDLEKYRRKYYSNLVAQAINQPEFGNLNALYENLITIKPSDLNKEVLPTTFAYAAVAALNSNDLDDKLGLGDNEKRLTALAHVLETFGQEFPRGYLIYIRHLIKANKLDLAEKTLSHPNLIKHMKSNSALVEILDFTRQTIHELRTQPEQKNAILNEFLNTDNDPLGHPISTLADKINRSQNTKVMTNTINQ